MQSEQARNCGAGSACLPAEALENGKLENDPGIFSPSCLGGTSPKTSTCMQPLGVVKSVKTPGAAIEENSWKSEKRLPGRVGVERISI